MKRKVRIIFILCAIVFCMGTCCLLAYLWWDPYKAPPLEENALPFINSQYSPQRDLKTRLEKHSQIMEYERLHLLRRGTMSPQELTYPDLMEVQIAVKVDRLLAMQYMFSGERKKALNLLAEDYHLGKLFNGSNNFICRIVGMVFRVISMEGMSLYSLNCCETKEEFDELWRKLEELSKPWEYYSNMRAAMKDWWQGGLSSFIYGLFNEIEIMNDPETRQKVADAEFELLRTATAAKRRFVVEGSFPLEDSHFAPLLPNGPSHDPFSGESLKYFNDTEGKEFVCYSVGPDERDNDAATVYDTTNGVISEGDIVVRIPKKRKFPFPREGIRANTAEEVRAMFPDGLPFDPFSDSKRTPLGISDTTPVYIWSFGPDVDQSSGRTLSDNGATEVMYDPTNGVVSEGDVFFQVPMRE